MNYRPNIFIILICLCVANNFLYAQDPVLEGNQFLVKINEKLWQKQSYSIDFVYEYFDSVGSSRASETYSGFYRKSYDKIHSMHFGVEMYQDENNRLIIDNESKRIMLTSVPDDSIIEPTQMNFGPYLSIAEDIEICRLGDVRQFKLKFNPELGLEITELTLLTDTSYLLYRINMQHNLQNTSNELYHYDESSLNPFTQIHLKNYKFHPQFSNSEFDYKHILNCNSQTCNLTKSYSNYTLINQKLSP